MSPPVPPPGARAATDGPYADLDTIDEPDSRSLLAWLWGEQGVAGEYLLGSRSVIIGRDPGSDIVLGDPTVSREHARVEHHHGQWWLVATDSTGRTWLNGQRIARGQRLPVHDGDRLRFGFHTQLQMLVPSAR